VEAAAVPVMRLPGAELSPQPSRTLLASGRLVKAWALAGPSSKWDMVRVIGQRDADRKAMVRHGGAAVTDVAVWPRFGPGVPRGDSEFEVLVTADAAGVVLVTAVALLGSDGSLEARPLARAELPGAPGAPTRVQPLGAQLLLSRGGAVYVTPPVDGAFFGAAFSLSEVWVRGGDGAGAAAEPPPPPRALPVAAFSAPFAPGERVAAFHALGDAGLMLVLVALAGGAGGPRVHLLAGSDRGGGPATMGKDIAPLPHGVAGVHAVALLDKASAAGGPHGAVALCATAAGEPQIGRAHV
jgi:hypothetical protein